MKLVVMNRYLMKTHWHRKSSVPLQLSVMLSIRFRHLIMLSIIVDNATSNLTLIKPSQLRQVSFQLLCQWTDEVMSNNMEMQSKCWLSQLELPSQPVQSQLCKEVRLILAVIFSPHAFGSVPQGCQLMVFSSFCNDPMYYCTDLLVLELRFR